MADVFVRVKESTYVLYVFIVSPFKSVTVHMYVALKVEPVVFAYTVNGEFPWSIFSVKNDTGSSKEQIVRVSETVSQLFTA